MGCLLESIFNPGAENLMKAKYVEEREEAESGDPNRPERLLQEQGREDAKAESDGAEEPLGNGSLAFCRVSPMRRNNVHSRLHPQSTGLSTASSITCATPQRRAPVPCPAGASPEGSEAPAGSDFAWRTLMYPRAGSWVLAYPGRLGCQ